LFGFGEKVQGKIIIGKYVKGKKELSFIAVWKERK